MDCSPPGSPGHGIFQASILECVAISFSRGSSRSRSNPSLLHRRQILYHVSHQDLMLNVLLQSSKILYKTRTDTICPTFQGMKNSPWSTDGVPHFKKELCVSIWNHKNIPGHYQQYFMMPQVHVSLHDARVQQFNAQGNKRDLQPFLGEPCRKPAAAHTSCWFNKHTWSLPRTSSSSQSGFAPAPLFSHAGTSGPEESNIHHVP